MKRTCLYAHDWIRTVAEALERMHALEAKYPDLEVTLRVTKPEDIVLANVANYDVFACFRPHDAPCSPAILSMWREALRLGKEIIIDEEAVPVTGD